MTFAQTVHAKSRATDDPENGTFLSLSKKI
jgi:hypothetical protein